MKRLFRILTFILVWLWCVILQAHAENVAINSSDARQWADSKGHDLILALSEPDPVIKYSKLDKMLTEDVNLNYISKFVIGKYAKLMSQEQTERYTNLFYRYVLSLYKQFNLEFNPNSVDFTIDIIEEHPLFTTVTCTVDPQQMIDGIAIQRIPVRFKLVRGANNRIQAVDVEIAQISMVIEYRKRFYQMIKDEDEDINWFLDKFDDKVRANEKAFLKNAEL